MTTAARAISSENLLGFIAIVKNDVIAILKIIASVYGLEIVSLCEMKALAFILVCKNPILDL